MAALPECPNHREKNCARSELILMEENEACFKFHCKCCGLLWMVTKDKTRNVAQELNRVKKLQELSERDRGKILTFYAPKTGWAQ